MALGGNLAQEPAVRPSSTTCRQPFCKDVCNGIKDARQTFDEHVELFSVLLFISSKVWNNIHPVGANVNLRSSPTA